MARANASALRRTAVSGCLRLGEVGKFVHPGRANSRKVQPPRDLGYPGSQDIRAYVVASLSRATGSFNSPVNFHGGLQSEIPRNRARPRRRPIILNFPSRCARDVEIRAAGFDARVHRVYISVRSESRANIVEFKALIITTLPTRTPLLCVSARCRVHAHILTLISI